MTRDEVKAMQERAKNHAAQTQQQSFEKDLIVLLAELVLTAKPEEKAAQRGA